MVQGFRRGFELSLRAKHTQRLVLGYRVGTSGSYLSRYLWQDKLMGVYLSQGDAKKVHRDCGVSMKKCIDLSLLARSVDPRWKGKYTNPIGLANLVATYEFLALGKGKITRSNWEAPLSYNQQECEYDWWLNGGRE